MKKATIIIFASIVVSIVTVGLYQFLYLGSNSNKTSDQVNMADMYKIPESNDRSLTQDNILGESTTIRIETVSDDQSINKKKLSTDEIKTKIVNRAFIRASKDIVTF